MLEASKELQTSQKKQDVKQQIPIQPVTGAGVVLKTYLKDPEVKLHSLITHAFFDEKLNLKKELKGMNAYNRNLLPFSEKAFHTLPDMTYGAESECDGKYWTRRIERWVKLRNPTTWRRPYEFWSG